MRPTSRRRDTGAVLPLVLVFVTVFSLLIVGLASLTRTNLRTARITQEHVDDLYARDAALESGINEVDATIGSNPTLCGDESSPAVSLGSTTINGETVSVSCNTTEDGSLSGGGFEPILYLTGNSPDSKSDGYFYFDETEGGTVNVDAKVYNEGKFYIKNAAGSTVDFGRSIEQHSPDCQAGSPPNRMVHSGSPWDCNNPISAFPYDPMPDMWVPSSNAPSREQEPGCRYFYPGRYNSTPNLSSSRTNYFASGVYYFRNNVGTFDVENILIGGEAGSGTPQFPRPACATDLAAWADTSATDPDPNDAGVVFIFEGDAAIKIPSNTSNRLELNSYQPSAPLPYGPAGLAGYSIIAPTSGGSNPIDGGGSWNAHTKSILIETDSLEPGLLAIHGLVFAPENHLKLRLLTNSSSPNPESYMFSSGLIIASVELITSGLPPSQEIHFAGGPGGNDPATIVIEATNPSTGRRSVATLRYAPGDPDPLSVVSWLATDDS